MFRTLLDPARHPARLLTLCCLLVASVTPTRALQIHQSEHGLGMIREWTIAGTFPNAPSTRGDGLREGFDIDYLEAWGGEAAPDLPSPPATLDWSRPDGSQGQARLIQFEAPRSGAVNLNEIFEGNNDFRLAYGVARLEAPEDGTYWIMAGSDDNIRVWVDGKMLHETRLAGRGMRKGDDLIKLELEAGSHQLVIKVENNTGPWGWMVAFMNDEAKQNYGDRPGAFPSIEFGGHPAESKTLSDYLFYHFDKRLGNGPTVFNKEYVLLSDLWLDGAITHQEMQPIQQVHRDDLLEIEIDPEGFILTHQHWSHAHDDGWPFPMWAQNALDPKDLRGRAGGWHFQETPGAVGNWMGTVLGHWNIPHYLGQDAVDTWEVENAVSHGIIDNAWHLSATGESPTLYTPGDYPIEAFLAPFLQLRWKRTGEAPMHQLPYVEWLREGDDAYSPERRVYFSSKPNPFGNTDFMHAHMEMHTHPLWEGRIKRMRLVLAPGESDVDFIVESFFTVQDTRQTMNNPIYILASALYFKWTGDLDFLKQRIGQLRMALLHQQTVMGGLEHNVIRNSFVGHDGRPGFTLLEDGTKILNPGHGIGNNYYDLLPYGGYDAYATNQYYAATRVMADLEQAILDNPGWSIPRGALAFEPDFLRRHAAEVKKTANEMFWNEQTGRFNANIDEDGNTWDYGFTFQNLDAIWYDLATEEHARSIMDWIDGRRIVAGDTSTGEDIYRFDFGPRATTRRNVEWYNFVWHLPESIEWGHQIQDGGAVLGFAFYDLWARLKIYGPDDAWQRLQAVLDWERRVQEAGGYRTYYGTVETGTTLQGGGTAGGIGVDFEFFESSMIPSIVPYGFMGIDPGFEGMTFDPRLPSDVPSMTVRNMFYRTAGMNVTATHDRFTIEVTRAPMDSFYLRPAREGWEAPAGLEQDSRGFYRVTGTGSLTFRKAAK